MSKKKAKTVVVVDGCEVTLHGDVPRTDAKRVAQSLFDRLNTPPRQRPGKKRSSVTERALADEWKNG